MSERIGISPQIVSIRHHLHQHPELGFKEFETTEFLRRQLRRHGIQVLDTSLPTGLIAQIDGKSSGPRIGLRADIDALPIQEETGLEFASVNNGVMHACGHDFHAAALLAAAFWLAEHRDLIHGSVVLVFQPSEESAMGARKVVESGALGHLDAMIGLHNSPSLSPGQIAVGSETMMAGCVKFDVTLRAQGAHGAHPDHGTGPIEALASMVLALQTVVSHDVQAFHPAVLSVTSVRGGNVWNVIPAEAGFLGTARYFRKEDGELMEERFRRIVQSTARAFRIDADIAWQELTGPVGSDPRLASIVEQDVKDYAELVPITASMGGDDFGNYRGIAPMVFASVGSDGRSGHASLHNSHFVGSDATLRPETEFYVNEALSVANALEQGLPDDTDDGSGR